MKPQPITISQAATNPGSYDPKPLQLIGKLPNGAFTETVLTAVPATFADEAAVRTYLATLVGELKASPYFS